MLAPEAENRNLTGVFAGPSQAQAEVGSCSFLSQSPAAGYPSGRPTARPKPIWWESHRISDVCSLCRPAGHPVAPAVSWGAGLRTQRPGARRGCVLLAVRHSTPSLANSAHPYNPGQSGSALVS